MHHLRVNNIIDVSENVSVNVCIYVTQLYKFTVTITNCDVIVPHVLRIEMSSISEDQFISTNRFLFIPVISVNFFIYNFMDLYLKLLQIIFSLRNYCDSQTILDVICLFCTQHPVS